MVDLIREVGSFYADVCEGREAGPYQTKDILALGEVKRNDYYVSSFLTEDLFHGYNAHAPCHAGAIHADSCLSLLKNYETSRDPFLNQTLFAWWEFIFASPLSPWAPYMGNFFHLIRDEEGKPWFLAMKNGKKMTKGLRLSAFCASRQGQEAHLLPFLETWGILREALPENEAAFLATKIDLSRKKNDRLTIESSVINDWHNWYRCESTRLGPFLFGHKTGFRYSETIHGLWENLNEPLISTRDVYNQIKTGLPLKSNRFDKERRVYSGLFPLLYDELSKIRLEEENEKKRQAKVVFEKRDVLKAAASFLEELKSTTVVER